MNRYGLIFILLISTLAFTACSSSGSGEALTEKIWIASELDGESLVPDTAITAEFDQDGNAVGMAGCNNYNTTYEVDGEKIQFGEVIGTTMMMCPEPAMAQEQAYLAALGDAETFEINEDELVLYDSDGNALVRFDAVDQELEGSSWNVIAYNNGKGGVVSVQLGTEITANFGEEGQLAGNSGCNSYTAAYETDGDSITITMGGLTLMACEESVMEQEQEYLAALETAATYKISGLRMEMRTEDGAMVADFQRSVP